MSQPTPPGGGPPRASPDVFLGCKVGDSAGSAKSNESGVSLLSGATPTGSFSGHVLPQNPAVTPTHHRDLPSGGLPINIRDPARAADPAIVRQEGEVAVDGYIEDIDFDAEDATSHAGSGASSHVEEVPTHQGPPQGGPPSTLPAGGPSRNLRRQATGVVVDREAVTEDAAETRDLADQVITTTPISQDPDLGTHSPLALALARSPDDSGDSNWSEDRERGRSRRRDGPAGRGNSTTTNKKKKKKKKKGKGGGHPSRGHPLRGPSHQPRG